MGISIKGVRIAMKRMFVSLLSGAVSLLLLVTAAWSQDYRGRVEGLSRGINLRVQNHIQDVDPRAGLLAVLRETGSHPRYRDKRESKNPS